MRPFRPTPRALTGTIALSIVLAAGASGTAAAAAPAPCNGVAQISDVASDGHHPNEDVLAGWFTEASGHLQAVVQIREAVWAPAHDDSSAAEFAVLFGVGDQTRYVRVVAGRNDVLRFDFGTYTRNGSPRFASQGATTGAVVAGADGYAVIDVPAATGAVSGATLKSPYVLTWDGYDDVEPHWVDRAPGGVSPDETAYGADEVVGACATGAVPPGSAGPGAPGQSPGAPAPTTAVVLTAPSRVTGTTQAKVAGRVVPARGGVTVTLTARTTGAKSRRLVTAADGTFATRLPISETTRLRAAAGGIASQTVTVTMRSTVMLRLRRLARGGWLATGTVRPGLPGRVLLLRTTSATATKSTTVVKGRFRARLTSPRPGRYQAVFLPSGARAERSTSKSGVIR